MKEPLKIKRLFVSAVALTLLILAGNYWLLSHFMEKQQHTAYMINISGKQRMHSQRAALWAERLVTAAEAEERHAARKALQTFAQDMLSEHELLLNRKGAIGAFVYSNKQLKDIYFSSPTYLDQAVRRFVANIRQLADADAGMLHSDNPHYVYIMQQSSQVLLSGLDHAVGVYQQINSRQLRTLNIASVTLFVSALGVIIALWWVVFRPMIANINNVVRLTKLQQHVAVAANESDSVEEGISVALAQVCRYMGWSIGHSYIYDEDKEKLISMDIWYTDQEEGYAYFKQVSQSKTFASGQGFIGEVYSDATPMWILDVAHSSTYFRKEAAQKSGLKAAFAFPIFIGRKAVAVMEFYCKQAYIPDETLLEAMANIGKQLGQVVERAQARERAQLLETVIASANDGVIITRADVAEPEIIYVNKAFTEISGYTEKEVIGRSPRFLQGEFTKRETLTALREALVEGRPFKDELLNYRKDGTLYWLDISIVPVRDSQGRITHFAAIERDITTRKKEEAAYKDMWVELKRANMQAEATSRDLEKSLNLAEEANIAKGDFLANMSHELRTPMNGVLGMASLLADTDLSHEQQTFVSTINRSAENLLMLLNDILDFSKIEAGALELENIAYDFTDILENTRNLLTMQAEAHGISLILDYEQDVPRYLWGDPGRMHQVLVNLVGNAIKFTNHGYVRLSASMRDRGEGEQLYISVEDTGVGIAEDKLAHIFDKFTQGDASVTRKYGGTGLGLAITKQLVELMGGEIHVESIQGKGSTFWFSMPTMIAAKADMTGRADHLPIYCIETNQRIAVDQAKVLLVEDYHINQLFADKLLRKFGFVHIDLAENGMEAIEMYRRQHYDMIFMDCQMPELDGYQATQKIRTLEEGTSMHTPIIAMTANAMMGDREKCLKAGMDDYLSKPLRTQHLRNIIERWCVFGEDEAVQKNMAAVSFVAEETEGDVPVNLEQLRIFTDGDVEEEKELAQLFLSQAQEMIVILEQSVAEEAQEAWKSAAHRFKGSSANLGAVKLQHICKRAEAHFADSEEEKLKMLAVIKQETHQVEQFFQHLTAGS